MFVNALSFALLTLAQVAHAQLRTQQVLSRRADGIASSKCTADIPDDLIHSAEVLEADALQTALNHVHAMLKSTYNGSRQDALSVAIVHASQPEPILSFNYGRLRMNESSAEQVTSDTIYRAVSISKTFTALSALIMQQKSMEQSSLPSFSQSSRLQDVLPGFDLPGADWKNGGSEITLDMLMSHTSGLPREGYSTKFDLMADQPKASADYIGSRWENVTPKDILAYIKNKGLIWAPGERASYSNAGLAILGHATAAYASRLSNTTISWSALATSTILSPLNLTNSFFGAIPPPLRPNVSIPGTPNWADLVLGPGYDPAAGLWTSPANLARFLHAVLLQRTPQLITATQRRQWLANRVLVGDGVQAVGPGWEIDLLDTASSAAAPTVAKHDQPAREVVYGKLGDGGGYHAALSVLPKLGYGVVVFSADSLADVTAPHALTLAMHGVLAPAFRAGYARMLRRAYAGRYIPFPASGEESGNERNATAAGSEAVIALDRSTGGLHVSRLTKGGVSVLERIDALSWAPGEPEVRFFSLPGGRVALHPSDIKARVKSGQETKEWRMAVDVGGECDWLDFDGYTDMDGEGVDRVMLSEEGADVVLRYPAMDIVYRRVE